jgi:signal transduction histidine kinase
MFRHARLKLTIWYVLIVMLISTSFSFAIYGLMEREVNRFAFAQRSRIERQLQFAGYVIGRDPLPPEIVQLLNVEAFQNETLSHILLSLLGLNIFILFFSGILSYLMAGKTFQPIENMLEEQNRFISDASHELKTPLTAIRTTFEVALRNNELKLAEAKELIQENLTEIENLQSLSEALLKLTSYQKQHLIKNFQTVQLDEVIQSAVKKVMPVAKKKHISIQSTLTPALVAGISQQLSELLVILLDNAIKYSPKNSEVSLMMRTTAKQVFVQVKDQGIGIPAENIPHIFNRFYRADTSRTKTNASGYGLGLAIAHKIVELHNGRIEVQSTVHKGSSFTFSIPRKSS